MNNGQRKAIRDKVKELLEAAAIPNIELYTFQKARLSGNVPAVCIYLEQGETDGIENNVNLTIRIMAPDEDNVDDLLDTVGDQVQVVIGEVVDHESVLSEVCQYITEQGFAYERDEVEACTVLDLTYGINY